MAAPPNAWRTDASRRTPRVRLARGVAPEPLGLGADLHALGLDTPAPVLILVGGAANLDIATGYALSPLLADLAPRLEALGAAVIDGGTAFGVMTLMGAARRGSGARFPLIGVAPRGAVTLLDDCGGDEDRMVAALDIDKARLDANHSHFLLTPGARWGDESPGIIALAERIAAGRPTLMLVVGGGAITALDVRARLRAGGRVLVLAGSGGTADRLAAWRRDGSSGAALDLNGWPAGETDAGTALQALVEVLDLRDAPAHLPDLIARALAS